MDINVLTNGVLENGKITIEGNNFYLQTAIPKDGEVKENAIGMNTNTIEFNNLNNGTQKLLTGIIKSGDYTYSTKKMDALENNTENYTKINKVTLTGTHRDSNGKETEINKQIDLTVDWYGTTKAEIPARIFGRDNLKQNIDNTNIKDEENSILNLEIPLIITETKNELLLSKVHMEGTIPELNGYRPTNIEVEGVNVNYTYDQNTGIFTIEKNSSLDEDGNVVENCYDGNNGSIRYNRFKLKVSYPIEAYSDAIELRIPVTGYYEGYNNKNTEFENPYRSNTVNDTFVISVMKPEGTAAIFKVQVGDYVPQYGQIVSKKKPLRIYNGLSEEEKNDRYKVLWQGSTGTDGESTGMIMREAKIESTQGHDNFIDEEANQLSMEDLTTNVGIYFMNSDNLLGEDGEIRVFNDETDELIATFTKDTWNRYTDKYPYLYEKSVKHIRIETSRTNAKSTLIVGNIKELDDEYITTNYTEEEFEKLKYIQSRLEGYLGEEYINSDINSALYQSPYSKATVNVEKNAISTQATEKNYKILIKTDADEKLNQEKWINGTFLLELPQDIVSVDINNVSIDNTNVSVKSYEKYSENGINYIKILTSNDKEESYVITVDCNVTPDPRMTTKTEDIVLYAKNENEESGKYYKEVADEYDIDGNNNKEEIVNKSTVAINMVSPNSLLTNQVATQYDEKGSITIAPKIAELDKDRRSAIVNIELKNNYSNTISDVIVVGRVPFEGNKYVINGSDMGSTFSTVMTNRGINIPSELAGKVTIYYSENEEATKDLSDSNNGWVTSPSDFSKVKSYLISFGTNKIEKGESHTLNYEIEIPEGIDYNEVTYSHHAVYFSFDTAAGKLRSQTEPNKIGFMIAKQFDLELTKYQKDKERTVSGATYKVIEIAEDEHGNEVELDSKSKATNENGKIVITGLYVGKTYKIKEINSPTSYELNEDEIVFTTEEDNNNLVVNKISGTPKKIEVKQANRQVDYKVYVEVEDEVKANLKLVKQDANGNKLKDVKYNLKGKGISESGRTITTNENGESTFRGIFINEEYTLTEMKAEGYYLASPVKFKVVNNNGTYNVQITEGNTLSNNIVIEEDIPSAVVTVEDEKIPTFDLNVIKKVKDSEEKLSGAKFKLYYNGKEKAEYESNQDGMISIQGLYQYEEERNIEQNYVLKEVYAPEGFSKVKDISFKVEKQEGVLKFVETIAEGQTAKQYTVDNNTINLIVEDNPSFKLIKKDGTTAEVLPGVKFAIYNVDNGDEPAKNSKGVTIGTKEVINGKEYYVVETNERGEITADLTEGLYKAVEVYADDKYDIDNNVYYFGVGASREAKTIMDDAWEEKLEGDESNYIKSVEETEDGGYIVGGYFKGNVNIGGQTYTSNGSEDAIIIKYDKNRDVEWVKTIGSSGMDNIYKVIQTSDEGYISVGKVAGDVVINGETYTSNGIDDGIIIKYDKDGNEEWIKTFESDGTDSARSIIETETGDYIVVGVIFGRGVILKYDNQGNQLWKKRIEGSTSSVDSVVEISSGKFIVAGYLNGNITIDGEAYSSDSENNTFIVELDSEGNVIWSKLAQGRCLYIDKLTDGGFVISGEFGGSITINGQEYTSAGNQDGLIIKYNSEGNPLFAKTYGGSTTDQIYSIKGTSDGGFVVGGCFWRDNLSFGGKIYKNYGNSDGLILKYDKDGNEEWAKGFGDSNIEYIYSVQETSDGNYIVGGYLREALNSPAIGSLIKIEEKEVPVIVAKELKSIGGTNSTCEFNSVSKTDDGGYIVGGKFSGSLEIDGETYTSNGQDDGIIIKYDKNEKIEWIKTFGSNYNDGFNIVNKTEEGGYITVGWFSSTIIIGGKEYKSVGGQDGIVIKYDKNGNEEWVGAFGEARSDSFENVVETENGDFIAVGHVGNSNYNGIMIKYDKSGNEEWREVIEGNYRNEITSIQKTSDGGFIVGGLFNNNIEIDGEIYTSKGNSDAIVIKYDRNYNKEWTRTFGGPSDYSVRHIIENQAGDYIVVGTLKIIKYDKDGNEKWTKDIRNNSSAVETSDGGLLVGGYFSDSKVIRNETYTSNGNSDGIIIKYDKDGNEEWAKTVGGTDYDYINSITETENGEIIAVGYFRSEQISDGKYSITRKGTEDGLILKVVPEMGVPEVQELEVLNNLKEFKITTDVEEIDGIKGGSISGEDKSVYESVLYGNNSEKEIVMTPDPNYEIIGITVNGKEYKFTANPDGTYTMPQFENVTENKHIVVKYSLKDNKITLNKVDKTTREKLQGASFKLDQIEERTDPNEDEIIGNLTDNGQTYSETIVDRENEKTGVVGTLINNGEYFFVEQDGKYVPTNSKTYQIANGGSEGVKSSTARSYVEIDLTGLTGNYAVIVNANVSSENSDKGYAIITNDTAVPGNQSERFMNISGNTTATKTPTDYISKILNGGSKYYLHLGYYKDGSVDTGDDQVVINSIKVYTATENSKTYNFVNNEGKYESTNGGIDNTVANSYVKIDLTGYTGKYNLTLNASISSESADYGYATITEDENRVAHNTEAGRFIHISGTSTETKDYTTVLQGGEEYYLHLGYYKDSSALSGDDKFTINSIKVTLNDSDLYHTEVTTNSDGQAITQIPFGKYTITETVAPEGYTLNSEPITIDFTADGVKEFTIENEKQGTVIVHHYVKGTTTPVAEDENLVGKVGDEYKTNPKMDIERYTLAKDTEGNYIYPDNYIGTFNNGNQEVIYYYEPREIPLTVHHYILGTTNKVFLRSGKRADDEKDSNKEGESYTTNPLTEDELSEMYELAEVPENSNGTYEYQEVEVTYYYKLKESLGLVVHHVSKQTGDQIAPDVVITGGKTGDSYTTTMSSEIPQNYTYDSKTDNWQGVLTGGTIEVTYYYDMQVPGVTSTITKQSTKNKITSSSELIDYQVSYRASISNYVGIAKVIVVDTLPYEIDEANSNIDGAVYDNDRRTLTWEESYAGINTYTDGNYIVNINKNLLLSFKNIDKTAETLENDIKGTIKLYDGSREINDEVTSEKDIPQEIKGKVIVKYLDKDTREEISTKVEHTDKVNVDFDISTDKKQIPGYELVAEPDTVTGKYTEEDQEFIYEYSKIVNYTVEYYYDGIIDNSKTERNTAKNKDIINTYVDKNKTGYKLEKTEFLPLEVDTNEAENIIKIYYIKDNFGYTVRYFYDGVLDPDLTENLSAEYQSRIEEYPIKNKTGYEFEKTEHLPLTITENPENNIINVYYIRSDANVIAKYIDKETGEEILEQETQEGKYGDNYRTVQKSKDGYYFIEVDGEPEGTMKETPIEVIYYYAKYKEIEIRYVDKNTNEEISQRVNHEGQTGESFDVDPDKKDIAKYTLVEEPDPKTGTYKMEKQIFTYYYSKNSDIIVKYVDKYTGEEIEEKVTKPGYEGKDYNIEEDKKQIDGYTLVEEPENKTGKYTDETQTFIYYYAKNSDIEVRYVDIHTEEELSDRVIRDGYEGKPYNLEDEKKQIDGYTLVKEPEPKEGEYTRQRQTFTYYYAKNSDIVVKYVDKNTGEEIEEKVTKPGHEGQDFDITEDKKQIDGYVLVEEPKEKTGKYTDETQEFIYYYAKESDIITKYVDKVTGEEISSKETENGYEGKDYDLNKYEKHIDGYILVETPEKMVGKYTDKTQTFIFYYGKESTIIVKYIDKDTGEEISKEIQKTAYEGTAYNITDDQKDIDGYYIVEWPENKIGVYGREDKTFIYYYRKDPGLSPIMPKTGTEKALTAILLPIAIVLSVIAVRNYKKYKVIERLEKRAKVAKRYTGNIRKNK